jgi:hypothetical protein
MMLATHGAPDEDTFAGAVAEVKERYGMFKNEWQRGGIHVQHPVEIDGDVITEGHTTIEIDHADGDCLCNPSEKAWEGILLLGELLEGISDSGVYVWTCGEGFFGRIPTEGGKSLQQLRAELAEKNIGVDEETKRNAKAAKLMAAVSRAYGDMRHPLYMWRVLSSQLAALDHTLPDPFKCQHEHIEPAEPIDEEPPMEAGLLVCHCPDCYARVLLCPDCGAKFVQCHDCKALEDMDGEFHREHNCSSVE